jgi:ABC-type branched-subunit amino acid transport system ATPase component
LCDHLGDNSPDDAFCQRKGLGRSFQDARLFPTMTVAECVAVAVERHVRVRDVVSCGLSLGAADDSEAAVRHRADELIETMGLDRYRNAFISELSTGTRRIVELASAMAHSPSVLLLDEPCAGIAQRETEALVEVLHALRRATGATLVVIEHDIPFISGIADDLVCMHLGSVIAAGDPSDVLADPQVVASYLGPDEPAVVRSGSARPLQRRPARTLTI